MTKPQPKGKRSAHRDRRATRLLACASRWRGRSACLLANEHLSLSWLLGGGHLASLSLHSTPAHDVNLLWEANWRTIDPQKYSQRKHQRTYGPPPAGKFLSGFTGHALCLDYFGAPSAEETFLGLPLHGEIPSSRWALASKSSSRGLARATLRAKAPAAGIALRRDVELRAGESVACVTEVITNAKNRDHYFQWVQHVTFGPPFLQTGESVCLLSGTRAKTWPLGYEGKCPLQSDSEFAWPQAPAAGGGTLDISQPFTSAAGGFVATTLSDQNSPLGYVAVLNWRLGLLAGYCFRRADFPWIAIWEENRARSGPPWNGKTQARGLEFGTSPLPVGLDDAILAGPLFGVPTIRRLPARGQEKASYAIFAVEVPTTWRTVSKIAAGSNAIVLIGPNPSDRIELPASGLAEIGLDQHAQA